jgi:hypothetical protein
MARSAAERAAPAVAALRGRRGDAIDARAAPAVRHARPVIDLIAAGQLAIVLAAAGQVAWLAKIYGS